VYQNWGDREAGISDREMPNTHQSRWVRVAMGMLSLPHKEEPAAFLPVIPSPLKQPAPASTSITVELTTGHRVTVNQADEQIVRLLLSALL